MRRTLERGRNRILAGRWPPYSRLFLAADAADWVLSEETRQVGRIARRLGIHVASTEHALGISRQAVFYASQFVLLEPDHFGHNRVAISYFHGRRFWDEEPTFAMCFERLRAERARISRVQVSNRAMRDFVLTAGVDPARVFVIPIGIDTSLFRPASPAERREARARFGVPADAPVVGSFQKDGVGWGKGARPKFIKGPDVFVRAITALRQRFPDLFVLLSGPARGYVRAGLEEAGVPYHHHYLRHYADVASLYHATDLYLVTAREEGGPKAVLEAMASRVPLVTTRVGQAADLVLHDENGWMTEIDDVEGIVHWASVALSDPARCETAVSAGRRTAEANAYERQDALWGSFFGGFVGP